MQLCVQWIIPLLLLLLWFLCICLDEQIHLGKSTYRTLHQAPNLAFICFLVCFSLLVEQTANSLGPPSGATGELRRSKTKPLEKPVRWREKKSLLCCFCCSVLMGGSFPTPASSFSKILKFEIQPEGKKKQRKRGHQCDILKMALREFKVQNSGKAQRGSAAVWSYFYAIAQQAKQLCFCKVRLPSLWHHKGHLPNLSQNPGRFPTHYCAANSPAGISLFRRRERQ